MIIEKEGLTTIHLEEEDLEDLGEVAATIISQNLEVIMIEVILVVIILEETTETTVEVEETTKKSHHSIATEMIQGNLNPESTNPKSMIEMKNISNQSIGIKTTLNNPIYINIDNKALA